MEVDGWMDGMCLRARRFGLFQWDASSVVDWTALTFSSVRLRGISFLFTHAGMLDVSRASGCSLSNPGSRVLHKAIDIPPRDREKTGIGIRRRRKLLKKDLLTLAHWDWEIDTM